jgi:hypothetical protein
MKLTKNCLGSRCRFFLKTWNSAVMETEGPYLLSEKPIIGSCPDSFESNSHLHPVSYKKYYKIIFPSMSRSPSGLLPWHFPTPSHGLYHYITATSECVDTCVPLECLV